MTIDGSCGGYGYPPRPLTAEERLDGKVRALDHRMAIALGDRRWEDLRALSLELAARFGREIPKCR